MTKTQERTAPSAAPVDPLRTDLSLVQVEAWIEHDKSERARLRAEQRRAAEQARSLAD